MRNFLCLSLILFSVIAINGCEPEPFTKVPKQAEGYRPIYGDPALVKEVTYKAAVPVTKAGKIYYRGGYIFQVDQGSGIHVINATNPSQTTRVGFISINGCQEIAIAGNYLFTNNLQDLITVDISDFTRPQVVKRVAGAFAQSNNELPPERGYFECPDSKKGVIIGWRKEMLQSPKCSNF